MIKPDAHGSEASIRRRPLRVSQTRFRFSDAAAAASRGPPAAYHWTPRWEPKNPVLILLFFSVTRHRPPPPPIQNGFLGPHERTLPTSCSCRGGPRTDLVRSANPSHPLFLSTHFPAVLSGLGATSAGDLFTSEVGDGNLNLVFIVGAATAGGQNRVVVKQALPYLRCLGEGWGLGRERAMFEFEALSAQRKACEEFVPGLHGFSEAHSLIVMEYLAPPMVLLRKGLISGIRYPTMASDVGRFCAHTLFKTSGFALSPTAFRHRVRFWSSNSEMCALTEAVVFTAPFLADAPRTPNRWTSPQLDADKAALEADGALRAAAARLLGRFVGTAKALLHGDLHTGSVMAKPEEGGTKVIDPEFGCYGPMGFDVGMFPANLLLAFVAQPGHRNGGEYAEWILQQVGIFWGAFEAGFVALWDDPVEHTGFMFASPEAPLPPPVVREEQRRFLRGVLEDALGFAGLEMVRRIVGVAHVEELESIEDEGVRAGCERAGLEIGKRLIKSAVGFASVEEVAQVARDFGGTQRESGHP